MKVRCVTKKRQNKDVEYNGLTKDKEYFVLAIEFYDSSSAFSNSIGDFILYRIQDNDGVVIPYPAKNFEIVSGELPSNWVTYRKPNASYSILPRAWAKEYFWDDYYNDDSYAIEEFKRELKIIYSE